MRKDTQLYKLVEDPTAIVIHYNDCLSIVFWKGNQIRLSNDYKHIFMYFSHSITRTQRIHCWSHHTLIGRFSYRVSKFLDTELSKHIFSTLASAQQQRFQRSFKDLTKFTKLAKIMIFHCHFIKEGYNPLSFEIIYKKMFNVQ